MFVPCPHCGFLVALIVADGGSPQRCPRCRAQLRGELQGEGEGKPTPIPATIADERPVGADSSHYSKPNSNSDPDPDPEVTIAPVKGGGDIHLARPNPQEPDPVVTSVPAATAPERPLDSSSRTGRRRKPATPSFARVVSRSRTGRPPWPEVSAASVLGILLAAQLVFAQRNELAANERWRPAIGAVCAVLWCDLPAWREPDAYTMLARSVQPAAGKAGILNVQASFRNDARWSQPWPALVLNLSDVNGQPIAARVFDASDYRSEKPPDGADELAPGQSASVEFKIVEPALPVVAFTFDFR